MRIAQAAVQTTRPLARLAMALAMALAMGGAAAAEPLLVRTGGDAAIAALPGIHRSARLAVGRNALAALRARSDAVVAGFPLGTARTATLELHRITPFAPSARLEIVEDGGRRALAPPDAAYFAGTVRGEPASRVVLVA